MSNWHKQGVKMLKNLKGCWIWVPHSKNKPHMLIH